MVGNHCDGVIKPDNLPYAPYGFGSRIVHAPNAAAEDGRLHQGGDLHTGHSNADAEDGGPVALRWGVRPLGWRTNELEVRRAFQRHGLRQREGGGGGTDSAVAYLSAGRCVAHF